MNDQELEQLAQRLGARTAERLDVERTAEAVVRRLREEPRVTGTTPIWTRRTWLKIAAALALVLGAGVMTRAVLRPRSGPVVAVGPVAEDVSDLTAAQLRETMRLLDQPLSEESVGAADTGLDGLTADELRALLRTLEG